MLSRPATHAGSWYSSNSHQLQSQITEWLTQAKGQQIFDRPARVNGNVDTTSSVTGRFGVGPHAGYSYCAHVLAETYAALNQSNIERVVVLGPSHCEYFKGARTTRFSSYDTPLGKIDIDTKWTTSLSESGAVGILSTGTDCEEHSIELHTPFIRTLFKDAKLIPIVVCDIAESQTQSLVEALKPLATDQNTLFVVSSDFCHWGSRFSYTNYSPRPGEPHKSIKVSETAHIQRPIYESIAELDRQAMETAALGISKAWKSYIKKTGNTVCGQKPLQIVLQLGEAIGEPVRFKWFKYDQSSKINSARESSVSYAAGAA